MFYGAHVWDPVLIIAQIVTLQCLFYVSLGVLLWALLGRILCRLWCQVFESHWCSVLLNLLLSSIAGVQAPL
jgi:protein SYS1